MTRVLGVLAGSDMPDVQLKQWVDSASIVFAADGGANRLHGLDFVPLTTVGDLDSISDASSVVQTRLIKDDDQNSTDCDKLLRFAREAGFQSITLASVEGDLLDHVLGTVQSAARSGMNVRFALRRGLGWVLAGSCETSFQTTPGFRFSMIPLEKCLGVTLDGTRWPLRDAALDPMGLTSLSNIAERNTVSVSMGQGRALVFVETDGLPTWDEASCCT